MTITQPASPDADASAVTSYRVMESDSTKLGIAADTTGGMKPIGKLPKLGAHIRAGY